jgi:hypothetical protein
MTEQAPLDLLIEARPEDGYLRLTFHGTFPNDEAGQMLLFSGAAEHMRATAGGRVLADMRRLAGRPNASGIFEYVSRTHPETMSPLRIAALDLPENLGRSYFYETLMQSRGVDFKLFKDEAKAVAWLLA